jgi:excisionase family DNA binding protein
MSARRKRPQNDGRSALPGPEDNGERLIRAFAQGLPEALDDEMAARLAARVRPFLTAATSGEGVPADRLLTVAEAASRAHVHVETIRRAVRHGRLAIAGRVGRSSRIHPREVDRWLAGASDTNGTIELPPVRRTPRPRQPNEHSLKAALKQTS